jgi:hypothetical protein
MNAKPRAGDLVFSDTLEKDAYGSGIVQRIVDSDARASDAWFEHVALVLNDQCVIDSVPKTSKEDRTGSRLKGGVRITDLGIYIKSLDRNSMRVLRAPAGTQVQPEKFDVTSPHILDLHGSEYTVEPLRAQAKRIVGDRVVEFISSCMPALTSEAHDIASQLGITNDVRHGIKDAFGYDIQQSSEALFCSQLAVRLLKIAGSLDSSIPDDSTPMGLYKVLRDRHWQNVSKSDYKGETLNDLFITDDRMSRLNQSHLDAVVALSKYAVKSSIRLDVSIASAKKVEDTSDDLAKALSATKAIEAFRWGSERN